MVVIPSSYILNSVLKLPGLPEILEMPTEPTLTGNGKSDETLIVIYIHESTKVVNEKHLRHIEADNYEVDWQVWYKTGFKGIYNTYQELRDSFNE